MNKRGVYLMVVVLVVGGVLVAVFAGREREPEYGGKRLSEWVEMMGSSVDHTPQREEIQNASGAIRSIGTNAIRFLTEWVQYDEPHWRMDLARVTSRFRALAYTDRRYLRADGAKRALIALGSRGQGAIPALIDGMVHATGPQSAFRLAEVLVNFGNASVPALLAVITNQHTPTRIRLLAAQFVPGYTNYTPEAVRALRELLKDPDHSMQEGASNLLREIDYEQGRLGGHRPEVGRRTE